MKESEGASTIAPAGARISTRRQVTPNVSTGAGFDSTESGNGLAVARYLVNEAAVAKAEELIESRQYVVRSEWSEVQPTADAENRYLERAGWEDYARWHLGLTDGAADETKARYAFVFGDLRRLHRSGLMACRFRATQWDHKTIELAAHDLIQKLDAARAT